MAAIEQILQALDSLTATVNELKGSIQLIEANIKTLNNRAAGIMLNNGSQAQSTKAVLPSVTPQPPTTLRGRPVTADAPQQEVQQSNVQQEEGQGVLTYKKVFGKLINSAKEPIENVLITVYDKNNELCGTTETDPVGYWEIMLRPGKYSVEYTKVGFKTTNKTFEVSKNAKETEVK